MCEGRRQQVRLDPLSLQLGRIVPLRHRGMHRLARCDRAGQNVIRLPFHGEAFGEAFQRVFGSAIGGLIDETLYPRLRRHEDQRSAVGLHPRPDSLAKLERRLDSDVHGGLKGGVIGRPEFGRFIYERWRDGTQDWLNKYPLTMDHPMLWEQSIHHFDLMRYVYDTEPAFIQAHTFNPSWTMYKGDTNVSALVTFENGMSVTYQGTWQAGHDPMNFKWRTDGSEGIIEQRAMFGDLAWAKRMEPELTRIPLTEHVAWITDAEALLRSFVSGLRGETPLECTGRDHLQSLFMLEACILASDRRAAVTIDEVRALTTPKELP